MSKYWSSLTSGVRNLNPFTTSTRPAPAPSTATMTSYSRDNPPPPAWATPVPPQPKPERRTDPGAFRESLQLKTQRTHPSKAIVLSDAPRQKTPPPNVLTATPEPPKLRSAKVVSPEAVASADGKRREGRRRRGGSERSGATFGDLMRETETSYRWMEVPIAPELPSGRHLVCPSIVRETSKPLPTSASSSQNPFVTAEIPKPKSAPPAPPAGTTSIAVRGATLSLYSSERRGERYFYRAVGDPVPLSWEGLKPASSDDLLPTIWDDEDSARRREERQAQRRIHSGAAGWGESRLRAPAAGETRIRALAVEQQAVAVSVRPPTPRANMEAITSRYPRIGTAYRPRPEPTPQLWRPPTPPPRRPPIPTSAPESKVGTPVSETREPISETRVSVSKPRRQIAPFPFPAEAPRAPPAMKRREEFPVEIGRENASPLPPPPLHATAIAAPTNENDEFPVEIGRENAAPLPPPPLHATAIAAPTSDGAREGLHQREEECLPIQTEAEAETYISPIVEVPSVERRKSAGRRRKHRHSHGEPTPTFLTTPHSELPSSVSASASPEEAQAGFEATASVDTSLGGDHGDQGPDPHHWPQLQQDEPPFDQTGPTVEQPAFVSSRPQYEQIPFDQEQQYEQQPQYELPANEQTQYELPAYEQTPFDQAANEQPQYEQQTQYELPANEQTQYEQPAYEQTPFDQPAYEQTQYEQPAHEQTQYEQPAFDQSAYEQTPFDQPADEQTFDQPAYDQPAYEQTQYEQPAYEQTQYEQPAYEQTQYEQPAYEQPQYEQPAYEQTAAAIQYDYDHTAAVTQQYDQPASTLHDQTAPGIQHDQTDVQYDQTAFEQPASTQYGYDQTASSVQQQQQYDQTAFGDYGSAQEANSAPSDGQAATGHENSAGNLGLPDLHDSDGS